jgi:hypothetical protein
LITCKPSDPEARNQPLGAFILPVPGIVPYAPPRLFQPI